MWLRVISLLMVAGALAVKRHDFKTCEQSAFCKRHRAISENTGYEVDPHSVKHTGSRLDATLQNAENKLSLRLYGLKDSSVRIQIEETETAIRKRFIPELALNGAPEEDAFSAVEIKSDSAHITTGDKKLKVVIVFKPFVVHVYNDVNDLVAQVNRDGKLKVEEYRKKEEGKEYPEGFWEETFKSFTDSKPFGSSSVGVDISFVGFRTAYGLPEHADSFALKTTVGNTDPYRLYNLDVFEYELNNPMSLYVAIPYIVAHKKNATVGALWLNAAETWIDTSSSASQKGFFRSVIDKVMSSENVPHFDAHFMSETGVIDIFFFGGPSPRDVQRQLSRTTGVTPLPPLFSIAYHQCRWNYNDEQDVAQVNENFDVYDIPMDVIWLDIEHTDGKKYFTWDPHKFAHAKEMIDGVAAKGRKMVTIIDPHIKKEDGYPIYKDAKDLGLYVKKSDGTTDFEGHCWPGTSSYLDFLNPETRKYWAAQFAFDRYVGSAPQLFTWNDMNEPSVFSGPEVTMDKDCLHFGGVEHRELHNMYGFLQHSSTFQGQLDRTGGKDRPFILTRSGFVGTQRTAAIWTGDNTAEWGHLAIAAPMLLSLSVSGVPFVGADVGGFFGNPDEQLLTRWYQAGAFQPFFRAHAHIDTKRREPWLFSKETLAAIRQAIRRRYALLPYWYALFREHALTGAPPMRPIWFEFPNEEKHFEQDKAWMVGNALLVHPVVEKDTYNVNVDLPFGEDKGTRWYEWETGVERPAGSSYVDVPITHIPVFQRGGTIIPTWYRIRRAASLMIQDPLTFYVALDRDGYAKGNVYLDDGATHDYKKGAFVSTEVEYKTGSPTESIIYGQPTSDSGKYETETWIERIVVRGLDRTPTNVSIIRASDPTVKLEFSYDRDRKTLVIRKPLVSITQSYKIILTF
ncbi:glycosyl hydrolase, family 31 [Ancylostoma caninum]|uniref:Glucosidase II subunit alpha n=1 Tax=Ancylostoma caninum TaxID=29170 RepID=A0A368GCA1_ANCCA|nr:glycosyl hydrolase, family 31 [Ancylostoma caninum]